jgi:hypothetical protein
LKARPDLSFIEFAGKDVKDILEAGGYGNDGCQKL